nr:basic 7s globulin 2 [Quercus suber]
MLPIATPLNALKPIATLATLALTRLDPGATCGLMVENPVTHQRAMGELAQDELLIQSTQGSNPGPMARVPQFLFTCAPSFLPITKRAHPGVTCLGFVDGGSHPKASIVIGAYQLEDNLLQFDLAKSGLGLSSSLKSRRNNCANFNFTSSP